eukprot:NODE_229_length_13800_cov_0.838114.p7 type:complete len:219 gc:universal NODE_229_length_13800_cov_0.838114:6380-7036(+)
MVVVCEWKSCKQIFSDAGKLYHHLSQAHCDEQEESSMAWPCQWKDCTVIVDRKYRLSSHLLIHTNYRPFTCKHCSKTFKRSHDMKKHIRLSHPTFHDDISAGSDSGSMESNDHHFSQRQVLNALQNMQQLQTVDKSGINDLNTQLSGQLRQGSPRYIRSSSLGVTSTLPIAQEQSPNSTLGENRTHAKSIFNKTEIRYDGSTYESMVQKFMEYTPPAH